MDPIENLVSQAGIPPSLLRANTAIPTDPAKWLDAVKSTATQSFEAIESAGGQSPFTGKAGGPATGGAGPGSGIGNIVSDFVREVDNKFKEGDRLRSDLLRGEAVNLHQVTIALQEAGTAFSLMVEFRNKMMEGYQELMRMQI